MSFEDWQKENATAVAEPEGFAAWQQRNTTDTWDAVFAAGGSVRNVIPLPQRPAYDNLLATVENPTEFEARMVGSMYLAATLPVDESQAYDLQESLARHLFRQKTSPSQLVSKAMQNEGLIQRYIDVWKSTRYWDKINQGEAPGFWQQRYNAFTKGVAEMGSALNQGLALAEESPVTYGPQFKTAEQRQASAQRDRENSRILWQVAQHPELAARDDSALGKLLDMAAETLPYIMGTTAAYALMGPAGGFTVGGAAAYNNTYQTAKDNKVPEDKARKLAAGAFLVQGAIESFGGPAADKLMALATEKIANRIVRGGADLTIGSIIESLEESGQEVDSLYREAHYRDINWREAVGRVTVAGLGGFMVGGMFKTSSAVIRGVTNFADPTQQKRALRVLAAEGELTEQVVGEMEQMLQEAQDEEAGKTEGETPAEPGAAGTVAATAAVAGGAQEVEAGTTYYHGTQAENVESIKANGFIASDDGTAGSGVYLGETPEQTLYERNPDLSASVQRTGKQPDTAMPVTVKGQIFDTGEYGRKDGPSVYLKPHVWAALQVKPGMPFKEAFDNAPAILKEAGYVGVKWTFSSGRAGIVVFDPADIQTQEQQQPPAPPTESAPSKAAPVTTPKATVGEGGAGEISPGTYASVAERPVKVVGREDDGRVIVRYPSGRRVRVAENELYTGAEEEYRHGSKLESQRKSEISKTSKEIEQDPAYRMFAEGESDEAIRAGTIGTFYVDPAYKGEVESYLGERGKPGANGKAWARITFDKSKGKHWDEAVEEFGWGADFDDFMRHFVSIADSEAEGKISERALEQALDSGDPRLQALAMKRAMLQGTDEFDVAETNQALASGIAQIAELYGLTQEEANGIYEELKIEDKHGKPQATTGRRRIREQTQGAAQSQATREDTGVFGQPVFRKATGTEQGLLPEAGEEWIGREPERPLLEGLEPPQPPTSAQGQAPAPESPQVTSARQAMLEEDYRAITGRDGVNSKEKQSMQQWHDEAIAQGIPDQGLRIAAEILAKPRLLSPTETAGLVIKLAQVKKEHAEAMTKIGQSRDAATTADLSARIATIEAEFETLYQALYRNGSEAGRRLAAQKLTINQDYSLIAVKARAKAAKGAELSAEEAAKIGELTAKLAEKTTQVEALEKELNKLKAEQMLKRLKGAQRLAAMTAEQKAADRQAKLLKVQELMKAGCYK